MTKDIIDLLKSDHETVRGLLTELQDAPPQKAQDLLAELGEELHLHSKVEEEIVYPAYRDQVGTRKAALDVEESRTEHDLVDQLIAEMGRVEPGTDAFAGKAAVLQESVNHHAEEEEEHMLPDLRAACTEEELQALAQRVEKRKQELAQEEHGVTPTF